MVKLESFARITPFAIYMVFVGIEGGLRYFNREGIFALSDQSIYLLYPLKVLVVTCLLIFLWGKYSEISLRDFYNVKNNLLSISVGLVVFVLWVKMDWTLPGQDAPTGFDPRVYTNELTRHMIVLSRIAGAALVVPIMEEIFWRSFLLRYIINSDFSKIPIGQFTWVSFLICAALFGLEHHFIIAGVMAGMVYTLLLYQTKSIAQCILAHAVTNFTLGIYVLQTGRWYFW
ncbi:CAAX prenyl protease-related protein [Geopsychrobacter electrodiphilus]|uniref:CAAX prenyl protease-related protein n=1 Tax=Geopsychrobacter electrodiphilus TaxID=225196 RepID=UPI00037B7B94|nr:CAAX prenyl protease-related protein [Geopsychrobacter electrodiphilus]